MSHVICDDRGSITKDERRARKSMLASIQLAYLAGPPYGDRAERTRAQFADQLVATPALSDLFALLDKRRRAILREMIENPAVAIFGPDGKQKWIGATLDLLDRLEAGSFVGAADDE